MKTFILALTLLLAGTLYAQTPCDCVFDAWDVYGTGPSTESIFLDTCDLHDSPYFKPGCETKQYGLLYPPPSLESYYSRIRSTVGWAIRARREDYWFSHLQPYSPGERFSIDQINRNDYPAIHDSLHTIFDEFGVTAQLVVFDHIDGITDAIYYTVQLDKRVEYVEMYDRLNRWMTTVGGEFDSIMINLDYPMAIGSTDENLRDANTSLNVDYANGQMTITNDRLHMEPLTVLTVHGATAFHGIAEPGRTSFDVSSLPTGLYLVKLGDKTGKCLIGF